MSVLHTLQRTAYGPIAVRAFDLLSQRHIYRNYRWLMSTQWQSPEELHQLQLAQLKRVLDHAWQFSPYYRRRLSEAGWSPANQATDALLDHLPALEKEDLQKYLSEIATIARWTGGRPALWSTGGSTGIATRIYVDTHTRDRRQAVQFRNASWLGVRPGEPVAYIGGTSLGIPKAASLRHTVEVAAKRQLFLPAWDLTEGTLDRYATKLARFQPRLLIGYSGAIHALAGHLVRTGRRVDLPAVLATGEMLLAPWRATIEQAFGAPVYERYGSIEVGDIGHSCAECGSMHVNDENLILQVEAGTGDLLVTDLTTFATPLIRYRIGDRVTFGSGSARCGRGLQEIRHIEGRSSDVLQLPGGGAISGMVFSFTPGDIPGVRQYQIWQPSPNRLQVIVVCEGHFPYRQILTELQPAFPAVDIEVHRVDSIPPAASGKRPLILRGSTFVGNTIESATGGATMR